MSNLLSSQYYFLLQPYHYLWLELLIIILINYILSINCFYFEPYQLILLQTELSILYI